MDWILLAGVAFLVRLIDAVVGGGGLILIPALFMALLQATPATLFRANKFAAIFGTTGHVFWGMAVWMAMFNVGGALLGSRLALRHGSGFVRRIFLGVATALVGKFGYDTFA
ncbi:MAG: hypothetical protein WC073_04195 [Sterolibacterium sp.]